MVSEEQLEFLENGSDKKRLFKVFWRGRIKQCSYEMGFGKYKAPALVRGTVYPRAGWGRLERLGVGGKVPGGWIL